MRTNQCAVRFAVVRVQRITVDTSSFLFLNLITTTSLISPVTQITGSVLSDEHLAPFLGRVNVIKGSLSMVSTSSVIYKVCAVSNIYAFFSPFPYLWVALRVAATLLSVCGPCSYEPACSLTPFHFFNRRHCFNLSHSQTRKK